ncbi:RNA polymerase sigma factor [Sorangium sp. So ce176]|uniref:RNA polymerase sigma factor n=1 Tax=Sorangium sp. So ce176 TaxID=3133286 RepID=UPI003F627CC5
MRPSFDEVYRSSHAYVLRLLWRVGVASRDLEDVAHEVFLVVHRRLPDYRPGGSLDAWLSAIASRVALRHRQLARICRRLLSDDGRAVEVADPGPDVEHRGADARHQRREVLLDASELAIADERPGAEELLGSEQQRRLVRSCMEAMAPEHRSLLLARHVDETPMAEIASGLGTPLSTTYKRHACAIAAFLQIARNDATG